MKQVSPQQKQAVAKFLINKIKSKTVPNKNISITLVRDEILDLKLSGKDFESVLNWMAIDGILVSKNPNVYPYDTDDHPSGLYRNYEIIIPDRQKVQLYLEKIKYEKQYNDKNNGRQKTGIEYTYIKKPKREDCSGSLVIPGFELVNVIGDRATVLEFFFHQGKLNKKYFTYRDVKNVMSVDFNSVQVRQAVDDINRTVRKATEEFVNPLIETPPSSELSTSGRANLYRWRVDE